jgi:hypothetical protein
MTFDEAKELAVKEAMAHNKLVGFHKWKAVSMNDSGDWFADTSESSEMVINEDYGFFNADKGLDMVLNVKFTDSPMWAWPNSLTSVPIE